MYSSERILGLALALAMFFFSAYMYLNSGDWVAGLFALGSLGYFLFFLRVYRRNKS